MMVERFWDEMGDYRLCVLSPFGARVHAAWGLALSARIRGRLRASDAMWWDDGIMVHLAGADEPPGAEPVFVEPEEVEELVVRSCGPRRCSPPAFGRTPPAPCCCRAATRARAPRCGRSV